MLTNLSFLDKGSSWPPPEEQERLLMYSQNRSLFEGKHVEVYREQFKRIERVVGNFGNVVSYQVILAYQKLISLKIADLLLGEVPAISAGDDGSDLAAAVEDLQSDTDLINTAYQVAIDTSRYGDGLFLVYKGATGGMIDVTQPAIWFPIVSPDNIKVILYHVLAWTYEIKTADSKRKYLKVHIHEKGRYEEREYELADDKIKSVILTGKFVPTGLDDFAVVQVPNVLTSDRVHGMNDYSDIDSIISELMVRVAQISKILDKHADPSVQGPAAALEKDPSTGEWKLKMGNYFIRNSSDDPEVAYLTWEGQLEAAFRQCEQLINYLYTISEMGSAIFGDLSNKTGQVPSGSALRRLMISPLAKVNRIRMRFDPALKKAIALCSQFSRIRIEVKDISITWQDGLPGDPVEEANIISTRTGGKQTMSTKRAVMQFDGLSEEQADQEVDLINEETSAGNPLFNPPPADDNSEPPV